jgi:hypothetical protein
MWIFHGVWCQQGAKSTALIRADEEFLSACQKSSQSLTMLTAAVNTSNAVLQSRKGMYVIRVSVLSTTLQQ